MSITLTIILIAIIAYLILGIPGMADLLKDVLDDVGPFFPLALLIAMMCGGVLSIILLDRWARRRRRIRALERKYGPPLPLSVGDEVYLTPGEFRYFDDFRNPRVEVNPTKPVVVVDVKDPLRTIVLYLPSDVPRGMLTLEDGTLLIVAVHSLRRSVDPALLYRSRHRRI